MDTLCFGTSLPPAGARCRLRASPSGIEVEFSPAPGVSPGEGPLRAPEVVPFSALSIKAGGFHLDRIVLEWNQDGRERILYLAEAESISALLEHAPSELRARLDSALASMKKARIAPARILVTVLAGLLILAALVWVAIHPLASWVVKRLPPNVEQSIGESAFKGFLAHSTPLTEGPAFSATETIVQRLALAVPQSPYKFQVTVVRDSTVNALAFPGGRIIVFTGLLREADSAEEVAGVLSHELNHVLLRHSLKAIVRTMGLKAAAALLLGNSGGLSDMAGGLGLELLSLSYSRSQETEADLEGLMLLARARVSSDGLIEFFETLASHDVPALTLLSTHPMSAERAQRMRDARKAMAAYTPEPFAIDWAAVKAGL